MADFCQQCSIYMFGEDFRELAGFKKPNRRSIPSRSVRGVGYIQVDNDGKCIVDDCLINHKTQKSRTKAIDQDSSET